MDWARDSYRVSILHQLRLLATPLNESAIDDAATVTQSDSDVISMLPRTIPTQNPNEQFMSELKEASESLSRYDTKDGLIRYAGLMIWNHCAVVLNQDNISTFLNSTTKKTQETVFQQILWRIQNHGIVITGEDLDKIEESWTGTQRTRRTRYHSETEYFTVISYTVFLSSNWYITHNLSLFAVAKDTWHQAIAASMLNNAAVEILQKYDGSAQVQHTSQHSSRSIETNNHKQTCHEYLSNTEKIQHWIRKFKRTPIGKCLEVAIQRTSITLQPPNKMEKCQPIVHCIVQYTYQLFQIGTRPPEESFIRYSNQKRFQPERQADSQQEDEGARIERDCVLVTATCYPENSESSLARCCGYFTSNSVLQLETKALGAMLKQAFESQDFWHTTRNHWVTESSSIILKDLTRKVWNLKSGNYLYGILTENLVFVSFIVEMAGESPVTQGSLIGKFKDYNSMIGSRQDVGRHPHLEGYIPIITRRHTTWRDPLMHHTAEASTLLIISRAFHIYKLLEWEIVHFHHATDKMSLNVVDYHYAQCRMAPGPCWLCSNIEIWSSSSWHYIKTPCYDVYIAKGMSCFELGKKMIRLKLSQLSLSTVSSSGILRSRKDISHGKQVNELVKLPFRDMTEFILQYQEYQDYCRAAYHDAMYLKYGRRSDENLETTKKIRNEDSESESSPDLTSHPFPISDPDTDDEIYSDLGRALS